MQIVKYILLSLLIISPFRSQGQTSAFQSEDALADRMIQFIDEYNAVADQLSSLGRQLVKAQHSEMNRTTSAETQLTALKNHLLSIDFRWTAFTQSEQVDIAASEYLMELMPRVQQLKQAVADTLNAEFAIVGAITDFIAAERLISTQDTIYKMLYNKAVELSLVKQLAPQLEKVKAEEQTLFAKIQGGYEKAQEAAQRLPKYAQRAKQLDNQFYALKALSNKIQAMEYKPPIERIKDYLMGLACVAVVLIFANMAVTKIQAAKKAREMLKKQQELFKRNNNNDYPSI